jgi:hypothetical protein
MEDNPFFIALWLVCAAATVGAAVLAHRSATARYVGRAAVAVLFVVGGALLHVINLVDGDDYSGFADPAVSGWITDTWESVVVPNAVVFIGLLAAFEAAVGVLALTGGRGTRIAYIAVIAFYGVLWVFGPEILFVLVMLPAMVALLVAEHRAEIAATPPDRTDRQPAGRV